MVLLAIAVIAFVVYITKRARKAPAFKLSHSSDNVRELTDNSTIGTIIKVSAWSIKKQTPRTYSEKHKYTYTYTVNGVSYTNKEWIDENLLCNVYRPQFEDEGIQKIQDVGNKIDGTIGQVPVLNKMAYVSINRTIRKGDEIKVVFDENNPNDSHIWLGDE